MVREFKFKRQWGGSDRVVWVDIEKLNAAWKTERGYYLPKGSRTSFPSWLHYFESERVPMPHIGLYDTDKISFTDGRNRFAWFRDRGAKAIPVTVESKTQQAAVQKLFGSRRRKVKVALTASDIQISERTKIEVAKRRAEAEAFGMAA